jgi:hypothetical protein
MVVGYGYSGSNYGYGGSNYGYGGYGGYGGLAAAGQVLSVLLRITS